MAQIQAVEAFALYTWRASEKHVLSPPLLAPPLPSSLGDCSTHAHNNIKIPKILGSNHRCQIPHLACMQSLSHDKGIDRIWLQLQSNVDTNPMDFLIQV